MRCAETGGLAAVANHGVGDEGTAPVKHDGPTLASQLLLSPPDHVTAYAVLLRHLQFTRQAVPAPVAGPGGMTLLEHPAGLFTVSPWLAGRHRGGLSLSHADCRNLGALLGRLHTALAEALPLPDRMVTVRVAEVAVAWERIGRYLSVAAGRQPADDFDRLTVHGLRQRARLLTDLADQRPDPGVPAGPAGWTHSDFHDLQVLWDGS